MSLSNLGYLSHYPVLATAVARTNGPVLELGCGYGSTPLLHLMCSYRPRTLYSLDADRKWIRRFKSLETDWHKIVWVKDTKWRIPRFPVYWSVAFVDCAPGEVRKDLIRQLKGKAEYILAHDSEKDYEAGGNYGYEDLFETFSYIEEYRYLRPYTLVFSDEKKLGISSVEKEWVNEE
jgi:hypothetical protein